MTNYIKVLEEMKRTKNRDAKARLSTEEINTLIDWYNQFSSKQCSKESIDTILELLYELYIKENIDLYPREIYFKESKKIIDKYGLKEGNFINLLSSYRKLVFES